jgi:hypothetical protein
MRFKVISCDALRRETCAAAARCPHRADLEFLPVAGARGDELLATLQDAVDRASSVPQDAIVVAYGLCGGVARLEGLESRGVPLVVPRAADCSRFRPNQRGICFRTTGWAEDGGEASGRISLAVTTDDDDSPVPQVTYRQVTYVTTAPGRAPAGREAAAEFRSGGGDSQFFDRLLSGEWDESEFLVVPPGWRVAVSCDGRGIDRERIG